MKNGRKCRKKKRKLKKNPVIYILKLHAQG